VSFESLTDRYRRRQCGFANTDKYFSNASRHSREFVLAYSPSWLRRHTLQVRVLVSRRETFYRGEGRREIIVKCDRTKSFPLMTSKFHREACLATLRFFVSLGNKLVLLNYGHSYFATEISTCLRFSSSLAITFNHESRRGRIIALLSALLGIKRITESTKKKKISIAWDLLGTVSRSYSLCVYVWHK